MLPTRSIEYGLDSWSKSLKKYKVNTFVDWRERRFLRKEEFVILIAFGVTEIITFGVLKNVITVSLFLSLSTPHLLTKVI